MGWFKRLFKKQEKQDKALCDCSECVVRGESYYEVPLVGGSHTSFHAGRCKNCGGWRGFPHHNLLLAIIEGTEETIELLEDNSVPVNAIRDSGRVEI